MSGIRKVAMVHRPMASFTSSSNSGSCRGPFDDQLVNHYAVEVGEPGNLKRFELQTKGKTVTLNYDLFATDEYQKVKGIFIETDVVGYTSFSDEEIIEVAQQLIREHGSYHLIGNNCKFFATKLFNKVTNVKGRVGAHVGEFFGHILSALCE